MEAAIIEWFNDRRFVSLVELKPKFSIRRTFGAF